VAIKSFKLDQATKDIGDRDAALGAFLYEIQLCESLQHSCLVRFIGVAPAGKDESLLVMELCEGGTLEKCLLGMEPPDWAIRFLAAIDVAYALLYLHSVGIIHSDIKAENVLLDEHGRAKIADLGCAQSDSLIQEGESAVVKSGMKDMLYASPEEWKGSRGTRASDVYSFGLLLWSMCSLRLPNGGKCKRDAAGRIVPGEVEVIPDGSCPSPSFIELITDCRSPDPRVRPTAEQVAQRLETMEEEFGVERNRVLVARTEAQLHALCPPEQRESFVPALTLGGPTIDAALEAFLADPAQRSAVVFGQGGLGKSLSTYCLAAHLLDRLRKVKPSPSQCSCGRSPRAGPTHS
jgi:serine/threonine protein kinase